MGKIVDHCHTAFDTADLHSALDRFESVESLLDLFASDTPCIGSDNDREAISNVEFADKMRLKLAPIITVLENRKSRSVAGKVYISCLPLGVVRQAKCLDRRVQLPFHIGENISHNG